MQNIPTPNSIKFNKETDYKGQFVIEPFYPGYGVTIGNTLRRVLLSSMPGAAIVSVKIKGAEHEFSALPYVKEDVVDIILNIKQINLSIQGEIDPAEPLTIKINKTTDGKITGADFECPAQVKIANPKQHIATLTDKASSFEMECIVEKGTGYLPTENRDGDELEIGHLAVDAIFTPINHVNLEVERVRVGEMTNWDKVVLSVETNGTITCEDAFDLTVDILNKQFNSLIRQAQTEETVSEEESTEKEPVEDNEKVEEKIEEDAESKKRGRPKKEDK